MIFESRLKTITIFIFSKVRNTKKYTLLTEKCDKLRAIGEKPLSRGVKNTKLTDHIWHDISKSFWFNSVKIDMVLEGYIWHIIDYFGKELMETFFLMIFFSVNTYYQKKK